MNWKLSIKEYFWWIFQCCGKQIKNMVQRIQFALEEHEQLGARVGKQMTQGIEWAWKNLYTWKGNWITGKSKDKTQARNFTIEGYQICQVQHPLGEYMLTTPDEFLVLCAPRNSLKLHYFIALPGIEVRLTGLLGHSSVPFMKTKAAFICFQSSDISPSQHHHSLTIITTWCLN